MASDIFKSEILLELNNFQKQKLLDPNNSIAQIIINLFLMRPGNIPGLPHIGINIKDYLYKTDTEINPDDIKSRIASQCNELLPGVVTGDIDIVLVPDFQGKSILLISIGIFDANTLHVGFTKNSATGDLEYLYEFEKALNQLKTNIGG
jgi:hypothetical protein